MSPKHWRAQMEKTRPAFLFVESAWRGNNGGWRKRIVRYEDVEDNPLRELLQYCRSEGIPTAFWNKEDPPHFDNFIGAAREFDFVFTSDADCVPRYREALGHDRVYPLPFAAQPRVHNPSREKGWPRYPVCFAGTWMPRRYPERAETLRYLLEPAVQHGLHVFDRNLSRLDFGADYRFPDRYKEAIRGTLTYEEMLTAYRCYDVMLNVNTVSDSPNDVRPPSLREPGLRNARHLIGVGRHEPDARRARQGHTKQGRHRTPPAWTCWEIRRRASGRATWLTATYTRTTHTGTAWTRSSAGSVSNRSSINSRR